MVHDPTVTASLISEAKEIREDLEDRDSPRASTIQASENMFDDSKEIATGAVKGAANKAVSAGSRIGGGGANVSAAVLVAAGVLVVLALG